MGKCSVLHGCQIKVAIILQSAYIVSLLYIISFVHGLIVKKASLRSKICSLIVAYSVYNAYHSIHKYSISPMYVASIGISELQCYIVKLLLTKVLN